MATEVTTPSSDQWTWRRSLERAYERLEAKGIKRLPQPIYEYRDLGEIERVEQLGEEALANMMIRYLAWYSYVTVEYAYAKAAYSSFDEIYEVLLGETMHNISKTQDGRVVKDVLKSLAIQSNEQLKECHRVRVENMQMMQILEGMVKSLEIRSRAIESEQIRRASVRKVEVSRF